MSLPSRFLSYVVAGAVGAVAVLGVQHFMPTDTTPSMDMTTDTTEGSPIRDYLLAHPEVVIEALQKHQENEEQAKMSAASEVIKTKGQEIFASGTTPVLGNNGGDTAIVEFFDYNCGYCRRSVAALAAIESEDKNLRIVHKHLPILGPDSLAASKVALAAFDQGQDIYEKIHKGFMAHEGRLTSNDIEKIARDAGADWSKILVDQESDRVKKEIEANYQLAQAIGISGTPAFIVGEAFLPGAQDKDTLTKAIAEARANNVKSAVEAPAPDATTSEAEPVMPSTDTAATATAPTDAEAQTPTAPTE